MLKQLACLTVIVLAPFSARAELVAIGPPPCAGQTLQDFLKFGESGCQSGGFIFKDFGFQVTQSSDGYQPLTPAEIAVTFKDLGNAFQINFASNNFVAIGNEFVTYALVFDVDPPPVIIRGFDEEMETQTPVFPGIASITTNLCVGGTFPDCETGNIAGMFLFHDGQSSNLRAGLTFPNVNVLDVEFLVNLQGNGASSDFSSFTATVLLDIPEPASAVLIGGGLLVLAVIGRRRLR